MYRSRTQEELKDALQRLVDGVHGVKEDYHPPLFHIPVDQEQDVDVILADGIEELVQSRKEKEERPTIVTLCGSTRFSEAFHEANLRETLAGKIVLSIGCDFKSDLDLMLAGELTDADKARLDELHLRKIDQSDEILVLNCGGYVGKSTAYEIRYAQEHEIRYAQEHGKRIRWLEPRQPEKEYSGMGEIVRISEELGLYDQDTPLGQE